MEDKLTNYKIKIRCDFCHNEFIRYKKDLRNHNFCSQECSKSFQTRDTIIVQCATCNKDIKKNKSRLNDSKSGNHFCSMRCSGIYNNRYSDNLVASKKTKQGYCENCESIIPKSKNIKFCNECSPRKRNGNASHFIDYTLKEAINTNGARTNAYSLVRYRARKTVEEAGKLDKCENCGYDKHVEVCHIKGIATYDEDTLISIINHIDNLVALCKNCHWELDHDLLTVEDIRKSPISESN